MSNIDKAVSRAKEALGALTGNGRLERAGQVDQVKGSANSAVDRVADGLADNTADNS